MFQCQQAYGIVVVLIQLALHIVGVAKEMILANVLPHKMYSFNPFLPDNIKLVHWIIQAPSIVGGVEHNEIMDNVRRRKGVLPKSILFLTSAVRWMQRVL